MNYFFFLFAMSAAAAAIGWHFYIDVPPSSDKKEEENDFIDCDVDDDVEEDYIEIGAGLTTIVVFVVLTLLMLTCVTKNAVGRTVIIGWLYDGYTDYGLLGHVVLLANCLACLLAGPIVYTAGFLGTWARKGILTKRAEEEEYYKKIRLLRIQDEILKDQQKDLNGPFGKYLK